MGLKTFAGRAARRIGERLSDTGRVHECRVNGESILLHVESPLELFRARTYATKEPETLEWIERSVVPGDIVYDVGANIGLYTLFAAKRLSGRGRVYAFEPEALNFAKLNQNIFVNRLSDTVVAYCLAVCDRPRLDVLNLNAAGLLDGMDTNTLAPGSALHSFGAPQDFRDRPFQPLHRQGAIGMTIDALWSSWGLEFPNHIKIDVDGIEDEVIGGAGQTLGDERLRSVLIELSGETPATKALVARLVDSGLREVLRFRAHSKDLAAGSPYESSVNRVFVRSRTPGDGWP